MKTADESIINMHKYSRNVKVMKLCAHTSMLLYRWIIPYWLFPNLVENKELLVK